MKIKRQNLSTFLIFLPKTWFISPPNPFFLQILRKKNFKHDVGWDIYLIKFSVVTSVDISSLVEDCTCASVHHLNLRIQICKFHIHFLIISVEVWINSRLRISKKNAQNKCGKSDLLKHLRCVFNRLFFLLSLLFSSHLLLLSVHAVFTILKCQVL